MQKKKKKKTLKTTFVWVSFLLSNYIYMYILYILFIYLLCEYKYLSFLNF